MWKLSSSDHIRIVKSKHSSLSVQDLFVPYKFVITAFRDYFIILSNWSKWFHVNFERIWSISKHTVFYTEHSNEHLPIIIMIMIMFVWFQTWFRMIPRMTSYDVTSYSLLRLYKNDIFSKENFTGASYHEWLPFCLFRVQHCVQKV